METKVYPNHVGAAHAIDSEETYSTIKQETETNEAMQIKDEDSFYKYTVSYTHLRAHET